MLTLRTFVKMSISTGPVCHHEWMSSVRPLDPSSPIDPPPLPAPPPAIPLCFASEPKREKKGRCVVFVWLFDCTVQTKAKSGKILTDFSWNIYQSVCLSMSLSVLLLIRPSVYLLTRPSVCLSTQSVCLSTQSSVNSVVCLSVYSVVCLSIYSVVCLLSRLSAQPSLYLLRRTSVCLSVCISTLSVCLSVYSVVYLATQPSVCLSTQPSVCLSVCLFSYPSIHLSTQLSVCLSVYSAVHPSVSLSVCLYTYIFSRLSVCLSTHPTCVSFCPVHLPSHPFLCLYPHLSVP